MSDYLAMIQHRNDLAKELDDAIARYRDRKHALTRKAAKYKLDLLRRQIEMADDKIEALAPGTPGVLVGQC